MSAPANTVSQKPILPFLLGALIGIALGGAVASGIFLVVLNVQRSRHQAEVAELTVQLSGLPTLNTLAGSALQLDPAGILSSATATAPAPATTTTSEENQVLELGKAFIGNLTADRLTTAYF